MISSTLGRTPVQALALSVMACACAQALAQSATLPAVRVTATRFLEDPDALPFGVSVVTAQDIQRVGAATVNEALMKVLGIPGRLDFYGGGDYGLDLRGFGSGAGSNQVIVIDGVRLNEGDGSSTRLAGIPIESIERIEVIRGSSAVLYGEGATAGVIVITTKPGHGAADRRTGQAYMAIGSDALAEARASASLASGGFSLDVAANRRASDGHRDNFRSNTEGSSLNGQWRNDWLRVGLRHAQDKLDTGLPGALSLAQFNANPGQTNNPDDHARIEGERGAVYGEATLGDWQFALDAGARRKGLRSVMVFGGLPSAYDYDIDARSRNARVRHSAMLGGLRNTAVVGVDDLDWTREVHTYGSSARQDSRAVYAKDDLVFPFGLHLSAGLRQERAKKTSSTLAGTPVDERFNAWEFGVVQRLSAQGSVYARLARSFRFPNADEYTYESPGAHLKPQTSRDLDLGVRWSWQAGKGELRYYRNALRDEIGFDPDAAGPFGFPGANVNFADPTRRQGLELDLSHRLAGDWHLRAHAAWREARFAGGAHDGKDIALSPRGALSLGADWQVRSGHTLGGMVSAVSSQHPDFANACRMPSYTTVDLRYAFKADAVELALGVANLADRKYYTLAYACASGQPTSVYPEAGRGLVASARVSF